MIVFRSEIRSAYEVFVYHYDLFRFHTHESILNRQGSRGSFLTRGSTKPLDKYSSSEDEGHGPARVSLKTPAKKGRTRSFSSHSGMSGMSDTDSDSSLTSLDTPINSSSFVQAFMLLLALSVHGFTEGFVVGSLQGWVRGC
jgi:hypothetical protein